MTHSAEYEELLFKRGCALDHLAETTDPIERQLLRALVALYDRRLSVVAQLLGLVV